MTAHHTTHPTESVALDPSRLGRRRFIAGAGAVAASAAVGPLVGPATAHASLPAGASNFYILPAAVRLADTRPPHRDKYDHQQVNDRLIRVKIADKNGVPADATAAVITVTAVNFGLLNHVTVYPTGETVPTASNLNLLPGAVTANMATVKIGSNGRVDVIGNTPCHLIVDVLGYYAPVDGAVKEGRYVTLASPRRMYDSRPYKPANESYTTVDVTAAVPPDASAVVINLTAAASSAAGHFTGMAFDAVGPPETSTLNVSGAGENRAAGVVIPIRTINGKRRIKIYTHRSAFIIVDVFGYYTGTGSSLGQTGVFIPMTPQRLLDTRLPGEIGKMWPNWIVDCALPAAIRQNAAAVAINVTGVLSRAAGHLTVSAARQPIPGTSNVNWAYAGAIVPNHAITSVTRPVYNADPAKNFDGGLQVHNHSGSHVLVDLNGYFYTNENTLQPRVVHTNPPPPPAAPEWTMVVPKLGLVSQVKSGDPTYVTDSGHSWHWTGTGYMGQAAHVSVFAHRTDAGGPYRYVHTLAAGDVIGMYTGDGREFTYRYVRTDIVLGPNRNGPAPENILAATRLHPGTTLSLIACTYPSGLPTSLNHRIIVTFELVSWREV